MRIGLVAPLGHGCEANPGWHMITDGIRYLARQAVPEASFLPIDMLHDNAAHWAAAATCDAVILCGNPRFSGSEDSWWEYGVWNRLLQLQFAGVRVIDGWSGSCLPLAPTRDVESMAQTLREIPRTEHLLKIARIIDGVVTRDAVTQSLYAQAGVRSTLLPCSSWWAAREHAIQPASSDIDAMVLLALPGHDSWLPDAIRALKGYELIASTWDDYIWARGVGLHAALICDVDSLLRLYARCRRVLAFRIHAAIPAASLACEVGVVAIDSRALACDLFDLPQIAFTDLAARAPQFALATAANEELAVETLKGMLCGPP